MQTHLNQRMIKHTVFFASGHTSEASEIGEHHAQAILPIKPYQRAFWWKLVCCQIPTNGDKSLAQFFSVLPIAPVPETAEPLITMCLRNGCTCPDHFPALAAPVARSTDVI